MAGLLLNKVYFKLDRMNNTFFLPYKSEENLFYRTDYADAASKWPTSQTAYLCIVTIGTSCFNIDFETTSYQISYYIYIILDITDLTINNPNEPNSSSIVCCHRIGSARAWEGVVHFYYLIQKILIY